MPLVDDSARRSIDLSCSDTDMSTKSHSGCLVLLLLLAVCHAVSADIPCSQSSATKQVDLGYPQTDPTAIQDLKRTRSDHYERVVGVLAQLQTGLPSDIPGVRPVEERFGVIDVCNLAVRTSNPPLRYVAFTLEGVRYRATLRLATSIATPRN